MAISVLMTVYNGERWLEPAIESVLNQTYPDFEFIIVDDGSTDATPEILQRAAQRDSRIRLFSHENMGVSRSVNRVLPEVQHDWIARFDADDVMMPDRLERQLAFLRANPDVAVASCFADYIDASGHTVGHYSNPLTTRAEVRNWLERGKVIHFIQSGAIVRRDAIEEVGGYRPEFNLTEDTDLWNRIAEAGHAVLVQPEVLMQVRIHERSLTRTSLLLQARQFRWLEDGARRRRSGVPEISFEEFLERELRASLPRRINTARREYGQILYKRAAISYSKGEKLPTALQLVSATLLSPSHTIGNIRLKWCRTSVPDSEAVGAAPDAGEVHGEVEKRRDEHAQLPHVPGRASQTGRSAARWPEEGAVSMAKILLLAYGCEPDRGSEAGIGWHWAVNLSQEHEVFVLTHPRGREAIEARLAREPRPGLHIRYVELPRFLDPWRLVPGEQAIQFRYIMWQLAAYRAARRIVAAEDIDIVHHVSWTTMTGPTLGWALGKPFIWGPVGSGQRAPLQMRRFLGLKGWLREAIRNTQVATVTLNPLARLTARKASLAYASNVDTLQRLQDLGMERVVLQKDAAIDESWLVPEPPPARDRERVVIAWASRLMARKSPTLAVEAFARLREVQDAELWFIGDGPLLKETRALAARLGVQRDVKFWGWIDHTLVPELLSEADIFLFTSLRDTCPMPLMEAMARGLPVVALDLHGTRSLPDEAVLKVPVTEPDALAGAVASALLELARSPDLRSERGRAAWETIRAGHLWAHHFARIAEGYREVLGDANRESRWDDRHGCAAD